MLVDEILPDDDVKLVRSTVVEADAQTTYDAIERARMDEDPVLRSIGWLRRLPERALALFEGASPEPETTYETIGDLFDADGCIRLAEDPGRELVVGAVGRFWSPGEPLETGLDRTAFEAFDRPGFARCVLDLTVHPRGPDRSLLVLEVRALATRDRSRQALTRFSRFVEPAAGLIARRALAVVQATAEGAKAGTSSEVREPTETEIAAATGRVSTLDGAEIEGRRILLRADFDAPLLDGELDPRHLERPAATIRRLANRDAGVVVIGQQTGPEGGQAPSLEGHAGILSDLLDRDVRFTDHIDDETAARAVGKVGSGEVLVLGNTLGAEGETVAVDAATHAKRAWVQRLAETADLYVNDDFAASHGATASVLGLPRLVPSAAGPNLLADLEALDRLGQAEGPRVMALGGADLDRSLDVLAHQLAEGTVDEVLAGGLLGLVLLEVDGIDTGQGTRSVLEDHGALEHVNARALLDQHRDRITLPIDVAIERGGERLDVPVDQLPTKGRIGDIGTDTVNRFADHVTDAGSVLVHGPMGVVEDPVFERGTHGVLSAAAKARGFSVVGGRETVTALRTERIDPGRLNHLIPGGRSLTAYLAGDDLPGLAALGRDTAAPS